MTGRAHSLAQTFASSHGGHVGARETLLQHRDGTTAGGVGEEGGEGGEEGQGARSDTAQV